MNIAIVCGSFHKNEVSKMLEWASDEASQQGLTLTDVVWVPGAMEVPLALNRLLARDDIQGAACLGIIEKGHTQHGLAMARLGQTGNDRPEVVWLANEWHGPVRDDQRRAGYEHRRLR